MLKGMLKCAEGEEVLGQTRQEKHTGMSRKKVEVSGGKWRKVENWRRMSDRR